MIIGRTLDTATGLYDFAADPTAGAIGVIDLGIPIPANAIVFEFGVFVLVAPLGGAGATIGFDALDMSVSPPVVGSGLIPAGVLGGYALKTVVMGIDSTSPGLASAGGPPVSVAMSIAVNALTAGKLQVFCRYLVYEF